MYPGRGKDKGKVYAAVSRGIQKDRSVNLFL